MFDQVKFGEKMRSFRKFRNLTQKEVADRIGVSEQAISKWENGECLPDVYNLQLLSKLLRVSADSMLEDEKREHIVETIRIGTAVFEIVEKPETIFAGKMMYAKDFSDINEFYTSVNEYPKEMEQEIYRKVVDCVFPCNDIHISVNFWLDESTRALGFVRETSNMLQPDDIMIYKNPASLYIRAYTDRNMAQLLAKKQCEIWELFAYIREHFMPTYGFVMAENGAQELEIFDNMEHQTGYAYMPVMRV